jgi:hypothetical protein
MGTMSDRLDFKMAEHSDEALANALAIGGLSDTRRVAADAELRLREHRAILRQADATERSALAAERAADAAERGAVAAKESAAATIRYAKYTLWLLLFTAVAAVAAWYSVFHPR